MLKSYFDQLINMLSSYEWIKSADIIRYDIDSTDQKNILFYRLRVCLTNGGLLEIMERIVQMENDAIHTTTYSFHWQNPDGKLIKRWDNAPHFPNIPTHPDHVHVGREDDVRPSYYITAHDLLEMIDCEI